MKAEDVRRAREIPGLNPGERLVLETLTDYASYERGAFLSRERLVRLTGLHPKTVQLHLRRLLALEYLEETAHAKPGRVRTFMPHPERWPRPSLEETPAPGTEAPPGGHDPPPPTEVPPSPRGEAPPSTRHAHARNLHAPDAAHDLDQHSDSTTLEAALGSALKVV